jgi:hypothetical protein
VKYVVSGSNCNRFGGCEQLDALMRVHKALEETNKKLTKELETRSVQEDKIRSKIQHELLHEHTIAKGKVAQAEELMAKALDQNAKLEVQTRQFELEREKLTALLEAAGNKLNVEQLRTHCCEVMAAIIAAEGESASAGEFDLHARVLTEVIADDLLRTIASRADYGEYTAAEVKKVLADKKVLDESKVASKQRELDARCARLADGEEFVRDMLQKINDGYPTHGTFDALWDCSSHDAKHHFLCPTDDFPTSCTNIDSFE